MMLLEWQRLRAVAVVTVVVLVSPIALADDVDALVKHGIELRKKGQDREALAEFQKALAIQSSPKVLAQVGLAEYALGLWVSADEHLADALKQDTDPWIKRNKAALTEAAAGVAGRLSTVEVWGDPAGADVTINGKVVGKLPSPPAARVVAGPVSVVVRAAGYQELTRTLQAGPGELVRENVQMVAIPAPVPHLTSAPEPTRGPVVDPRPLDPGEKPVGLTHKWWFWTIVGAAVVGGVVAAVALSRSGGTTGCPSGVECPP
jgi:hypothetical protein